MEVDSKKPRVKRPRKKNKMVNLTDTNKYKHWETRAVTLGFLMQYCPHARADLQRLSDTNGREQGVELFLNGLRASGAIFLPYREPALLPNES